MRLRHAAVARSSSSGSPTRRLSRLTGRSTIRNALAVGDHDRRHQALRPCARADRDRSSATASPAARVARAQPATSKPSPASATVSMPTCNRISAPLAARSAMAWREAAIEMTSPSQGARSTPTVGSIATPSPSMRCANTASGTSSSGAHQPCETARACEHTVYVTHGRRCRRQRRPRVDHPASDPSIDAAREHEAQVVLHRCAGDRRRRAASSRAVIRTAGASGSAGDLLAFAAVEAHFELARRRSAACGNGIFFTSLPIWKLNGIWPTDAAIARDAPTDPRRVQIQHGFMMSTRNTARSPCSWRIVLERQQIAVAARLELVAGAVRPRAGDSSGAARSGCRASR